MRKLIVLLSVFPMLYSRSYFEVSQGLTGLTLSDKKSLTNNALCNLTIQATVYALVQDIATDIAPQIETYLTISSSMLAVNYTVTYSENYYVLLKNRLKSSVSNNEFTSFMNNMATVYGCSPLYETTVLLRDFRISNERIISDNDDYDDAPNIEQANYRKALSNVVAVLIVGLIALFFFTVFKVIKDHPEIKQDPKIFVKEVYDYLYEKLDRKDPDDNNVKKTFDDTENPLNRTSENEDESSLGNIYAKKDDNFGIGNTELSTEAIKARNKSRQSLKAPETSNSHVDNMGTVNNDNAVTGSLEMSPINSILTDNISSGSDRKKTGRASVSFTLREATDIKKKAVHDDMNGPSTNIPFGGLSSSSSLQGTPPSLPASHASPGSSAGINMAALAKRRTSVVTPSAMKKTLNQLETQRNSMGDGKDGGDVVWHSKQALGDAVTSPERRQELEKLSNLLNEFDK